MTKPLCIDLFCGYGGWAKGFSDAGYRVVGFDIEPECASRYRANGGEFVLADVRGLDGRRFKDATVIVASPPCTKFSRLANGFLRPAFTPDLSLVEAAWRIAKEAGVPIILENVEGARRWLGPAVAHRGSFYFWGDVPLLPLGKYVKEGGIPRNLNPWCRLPDDSRPRLKRWGERDRTPHGARIRAMLPYPLARAIAEAWKYIKPNGVRDES